MSSLDTAFRNCPLKTRARAARIDLLEVLAAGCRTAGRHPRRHAKSNSFAARRRPVRVPRDRRRSPSRPARRARSTRRAWPRSRARCCLQPGMTPVPITFLRPQNRGAVIRALPAASCSENNARFLRYLNGFLSTKTGYPPTADRDADRKLARLRTPAGRKIP